MLNKILSFFGLKTIKDFYESTSYYKKELSDLEEFYLNNINGKEAQISKLKEELEFYKKISKINKKVNLNNNDYMKKLREALNKIEELDKNKLKKWSKRIRSVGKCDICEDTKNLTAHHLWDKNSHGTIAYQDENGVCLCKSCHEGFHKQYTQKSQTTPLLYNKYKITKLNDLNMKKSFS